MCVHVKRVGIVATALLVGGARKIKLFSNRENRELLRTGCVANTRTHKACGFNVILMRIRLWWGTRPMPSIIRRERSRFPVVEQIA